MRDYWLQFHGVDFVLTLYIFMYQRIVNKKFKYYNCYFQLG